MTDKEKKLISNYKKCKCHLINALTLSGITMDDFSENIYQNIKHYLEEIDIHYDNVASEYFWQLIASGNEKALFRYLDYKQMYKEQPVVNNNKQYEIEI